MPISLEHFNSYVEHLKDAVVLLVVSNYGDDFANWFLSEAELDMAELYVERFKLYYLGNIDELVELRFEFLAKGLIAFIKTHAVLNTNTYINDLPEYIKTYIDIQMSNFDIDFSDLIVLSENGEEDPI
jgi:hypothetical protein